MTMDAANVISNVVVVGIPLLVWRSLDTRISQLYERVSQIEERIAHLGERVSRIEGLLGSFARIRKPVESEKKV